MCKQCRNNPEIGSRQKVFFGIMMDKQKANQMNLHFPTNLSQVDVHALPCTVHRNGEANVKKFFGEITRQEKEKKDGEGLMHGVDCKSNFRGRPLNGKKIDLKKMSVSGCILRVGEKTSTAIANFPEFTNFKLDVNPLTEKELNSSLFYLSNIAPILHQKIES